MTLLPPPPRIPPPLTLSASLGAAVGVLGACGWPQDIVVLDWETYFSKDYHLKGKGDSGLSTIEYIEDKRFEEEGVACLMVRGKLPYSPRQSTFWPGVKEQIAWLQSQFGENLEECTVVIQNARFDGTILVRKHHITPPFVVDTKYLSAHLDARNSHSLKDLCERYNLPAKGETMKFLGLRWATMTEEQRIAYAAYANNDAEREADLLAILLPKLTRPDVELVLQRHTLRLYWEPELAFDFAEADRLAGLMEAQVAKDMPEGTTPKEISGNISFVKLLGDALAETGELVPFKQGKKKEIPALAKDDEALKGLRLHRNPRVRNLIKARQAIKSWPLHVKRIRAMTAQATAAGGRLPNPLNYYGAHTGRWSGGEGINTCNLPTRGGGLACEMKHCLIAPTGSVLIHADSAQIEARGNAWIAGQTDLIAAFARGEDVYSQFAAETLAAPCRKPRKSDPPAVAKVLGGRRALGKVGILGMGYGMGADRALEYMLTYPELAPKVESGEIDWQFCKRFVDNYRRKYSMIPKFWRDLEATFRYVTKYGKDSSLRGLTMQREGSTTRLRLPSGRELFYPHAGISDDGTQGGRLRFHWGDLWGGTLTENVVQAMSRDVLAEAILRIEYRDIRIAHHVYDSVIAVVPEAQAERALAIVEEELRRRPIWAPDWPLDVEASISKRYE